MALFNFFGAASGLDTGSIINALLEQQRQARIDPLEKKILSLSDTKTALGGLSEKLSALKDAAANFRTISGGAVAKQVSVSDETVLTATASNAAYNTSATVNVLQTASNGTLSFNNSLASTSTAINSGASAGTVDFTIGTGGSAESFSVAVDGTTTAQQFVEAFNSSTDKAIATTVNVGTSSSPQYKIVISSTNEGTAEGQLSATDNASLFSGQTLDQATDAQFTISGISGTITRSTNTVSDVISGVTLNLSKPGSSTITVASDTETTAAGVEELVDAYNDLLNFIKEKDAVTFQIEKGNQVAVFGALAKSSLDESSLSAIKSAFSASSVAGSSVATLADLGITTQKDGTLKFNKDTFTSALASNPNAVSAITANLGEQLAKTGGTIDQFTQFNGLIDLAEKSTDSEISSINSKIINIEKLLAKQEESLIGQFSRLESQISKMQAQGSYLESIISSLG